MISGREPPWFDQVSPNLLRNRNIREYLSNFTSKDHPEVVKLTLLFGIVNLRKLFSGKLFSIENLREILTSHQVAAAVESSLPDVRTQLDNLQNQLEDITEMVYDRHRSPAKEPRTADRPPSPHLPWKQFSVSAFNGHQDSDVRATDNHPRPKPKAAAEAAKNLRHGSASPPNQRRSGPVRKSVNAIVPAAVLPSSDWRYDVSRTWSPPGRRRSPTREEDRHIGPVYPSWWGDGSNDPPQVAPKPKMPVRESKQPPRLAYSVLPDPVPIFQDDLVTSRYLQVPSSRYGNATITTTQGNQQQVATKTQGRVAADTNVADTRASQDEYHASITLNPAAARHQGYQGWLLPAQPKGLQGVATADGTLPSDMINRDTPAPPAWYDMLQSVLEPSKHQQTPSSSDMSSPPRPSALQTQHVTSHSLQSQDHAYYPPSEHPISRTAEKTGVVGEDEWSDHLPVQTHNVELQGAGLSWSTSQNMNAGRSESPDAAAGNDQAMDDGREQDEVVNSQRAGMIRMGSLQAGPSSSADRGGGDASSKQQRLRTSYGGGIGSSHYDRVESRIKEQVRKDRAAAAAAAGLLMNQGTYVVPFPGAALETSTVPLSSDRLLIQQQTDVQQKQKLEASCKHVGGGHGVNGTPTHRYQPAAAAAAHSHLNKPSSLAASSSPAAPAITGLSPAAAASLPSSSHSTPSQIVDRLASNPWTAWTLKDLDTKPQQQPNPGHGIKAEAIAVQTLDSNASPASYNSSALAPENQPWWLIPQEHASDVSTDTERSLLPNTAAAALRGGSGGNQKLAGTDNTQAPALMYSLQDGGAHNDPPPYQMLSATAGRASTPGFLFSPGPLFEADHSASRRAVTNPSTNSWRAQDNWVLSSNRPTRLTSLLGTTIGPSTTPQTLSSSGIGVACPEVPAAASYSLVAAAAAAAAAAAGPKKVAAGAVRGGVAWEVPGPSPAGDLKAYVVLQSRAAGPHSGARQSKGSGWMGDFGHLDY